MEGESQMYTANINNADSDKRSEDDMKYGSVVEKRHEMVWKCTGLIGTCSCMYGLIGTCSCMYGLIGTCSGMYGLIGTCSCYIAQAVTILSNPAQFWQFNCVYQGISFVLIWIVSSSVLRARDFQDIGLVLLLLSRAGFVWNDLPPVAYHFRSHILQNIYLLPSVQPLSSTLPL